ncbi:MAG: flagellar filament capping protein FliD, partial [Planctomycetota bacterium]|nr:flagellar filament capping protein FliD [Planctomycetota bacterium]
MVNGVDGLISGIPTGELIDSLVDLGRGRARQLEARKVEAEARLELVRSYNLRLLSAKLDLGELSRDSLYEGRSLSSSNEAAVTGTASSSAQSGSVTFSVDQLAEAHELATEGQASSTSDIGAGDITLQVGNGQQVTVSMGASDSSLDDIAAAINQADAGVSAYVINDGGANPYRLVLQGQDTGKDNTISVSATGAMALSDLFDQGGLALTELTAAANAEITLGTSGSLTIESATNQVSGVVPGVTLDLHETASRVTISVGQETEPVKERIMTFVESMNAAIEFLNLTTSYDPATNDAGLLIGDSDLRQGMNRMIRELTQAVPGLDGKNTLSAIGITLDRQDGTLQVDEGKLDGVLASDPDAVRNIFNNSGVSSDPGVSFATVSTKTDVSNPFAIEITQAASRAAVSTYQDVQTSGGLVTISDGVNDQLSLSAGGTSVSLQLAAGDYTTQALADHLQALVDAEFTGSSKMSVVMDGDRLALESVSFGGSRSIIVGASSATATLGLDTGTFTGSDVA